MMIMLNGSIKHKPLIMLLWYVF